MVQQYCFGFRGKLSDTFFQPSRLVAAFFDHLHRGYIAIHDVAVGRHPKTERTDRLFDQGHVARHDLARKRDQG